MGDLLTLVFGSEQPLVAANYLFSHKETEDKLFHNNGLARGLVVAPTLPQNYVAETLNEKQKPSTEELNQASSEFWSGKVKTIVRDFSRPTRISESWWHPEKSYLESSLYGEDFIDTVRFHLESVDRFGGLHLFSSSNSFQETPLALMHLADEVCGSFLLKSKSICFSFSANPEPAFQDIIHFYRVAPMVGTLVPIPSNHQPIFPELLSPEVLINTWTLPYRIRSQHVGLDSCLSPITSFPSSVSISTFSSQYCPSSWASVGVISQGISVDSQRHVTRRLDRTNVGNVFLQIEEESTRWLKYQARILCSKGAIDFSLRKGGMEHDEHGEMIENFNVWTEEYGQVNIA